MSARDKQDAIARGLAHLSMLRDELEQAGRPPGEIVSHTRQVYESMMNSIGVMDCAFREIAENDRG